MSETKKNGQKNGQSNVDTNPAEDLDETAGGIEDALADDAGVDDEAAEKAKPDKAQKGGKPEAEKPKPPAKSEPAKPQASKPTQTSEAKKAAPAKSRALGELDPVLAERTATIEAEIKSLGDPQAVLDTAVKAYRQAHADREAAIKDHDARFLAANTARRRAEQAASRDMDRLRLLREQLAKLTKGTPKAGTT